MILDNGITHALFFLGPDGAHLNVSWRPKVIDPDKSIQLYFDITNRKIYFIFHANELCFGGGGLRMLSLLAIIMLINWFFFLNSHRLRKGSSQCRCVHGGQL